MCICIMCICVFVCGTFFFWKKRIHSIQVHSVTILRWIGPALVNPNAPDLKPSARSMLVAALRLLLAKTVHSSTQAASSLQDYPGLLASLNLDAVFANLVPSLDENASGLNAALLLTLPDPTVNTWGRSGIAQDGKPPNGSLFFLLLHRRFRKTSKRPHR